jgi:hypothetical protein
VIAGTTPEISLTNVDNTISGAGMIGGGQMSLDNQGLIHADGSHGLIIDTGANEIVNSGTLESSGSGGLYLNSALLNSGQLWALGSDIAAKGAVSGGSALIDEAGSIEFSASSSASVSFGDAAPGAVNTLKLVDSDAFSGTVAGLNADDVLDFGDIDFAAASLSYTANETGTGGTLTVSDGMDTANVTLIGQYTAGSFSFMDDLAGGTMVMNSNPVV